MDGKKRWSCRADVCLQSGSGPGSGRSWRCGRVAGLGMLRLKNAATPLTKAVVSSGGDGTAMGIEQC